MIDDIILLSNCHGIVKEWSNRLHRLNRKAVDGKTVSGETVNGKLIGGGKKCYGELTTAPLFKQLIFVQCVILKERGVDDEAQAEEKSGREYSRGGVIAWKQVFLNPGLPLIKLINLMFADDNRERKLKRP